MTDLAADALGAGLIGHPSQMSLQPPSATRDLVVAGFARSLLAKIALLNETPLSKRQQAPVLSGMTQDIRKLTDVLVPDLMRPEVSVAAKARADAIGIDLCAQSWQAQPRFDPGRVVFHLEHLVPVNAVREACVQQPDEESISRVLLGIRLVWVLKAEDQELTRLKYQSIRPDPLKAYAHAGITIVTCHDLPMTG